METSLFYYELPPERIAQHSVEPRERAKLLVVDRAAKSLKDKHISDLPALLKKGDLLVFNDSKVFKARIRGKRGQTVFELFLLRPVGNQWEALANPGRRIQVGDVLDLTDGTRVRVEEKGEDGIVRLDFGKTTEQVFALTDRIGEVPIPPYVKKDLPLTSYQTVYAKDQGSVAAPTAGFHFTSALLKQLQEKGVQTAFVTLHVGIGTFRPMKTERLAEHVMHEEWANVSQETIERIRAAKKEGRRVIAVGTTTVRALESSGGKPFSDFTKLFITPGYSFKMIDGLLTNFHLPKSTLLVLVSAFAGREFVLDAYKHAIEHDYRFYSFGDAMLIV